MFYKIIDNLKIYTLEEEGTESAHPARFSPEDKFSKQRIEIKRRFKIRPFEK
ncbi:H/ACA ribonucleoprotein complex subunit 3 [Nosema bombycis CQ1]|uniref:H/ACA ribonucleoprotein complex subunit NOP10 n=1 Tax=Nosema bombycis (strain CQ1 / CVCC 102059) TaxID=578461 RepID=R0MAE8_NOSB1|nr:H/ACA ribonucleoprotein complex subunit 3 [Nosema bombycis CQ1]|eukprot:EOB14914.1 H/ACA ribonucleoprotein complex subunit 3 [Nosema bombycis CQ1]